MTVTRTAYLTRTSRGWVYADHRRTIAAAAAVDVEIDTTVVVSSCKPSNLVVIDLQSKICSDVDVDVDVGLELKYTV